MIPVLTRLRLRRCALRQRMAPLACVARPLVRFQRWALSGAGQQKRLPATVSVDFMLTCCLEIAGNAEATVKIELAYAVYRSGRRQPRTFGSKLR